MSDQTKERDFHILFMSLPLRIRKLYTDDPTFNKVIRLCFDNGLDKEAALINLVLFLHHERENYRDMLIMRESNRTQPLFYKGETQ